MLRAVAAALCCVAVAWSAVAADAPPRPLDLFDLGAPSFTNFAPSSGVPEAVTVGVQTDREGFVWTASPEGLARYDGRRWTPSPDPTLAHSATSLWLDRGGTLWAGFRDDGLAHYDGNAWQVENRASGLPSQQIRRFAETRNADDSWTLWALTWDQGLLRRREGRWQVDPRNAQLPRGAVLALAQTQTLGGGERIWAGSATEGLWFSENGGAWQRYESEGFDPAQVEYLFATTYAGREELWISVFGVGLWRLSADGLRRWTRESGELPTNDIYDIAQTPLPGGDRAIWVSSRSGLIRIHDDEVQVYGRRHGLPSDVVRAISAWRSPNGDNVLWLATENGVSRTIVGANRWLTASLMGAQATGVFAVLVEPDAHGGERLWVGGSDEGIGLFEQGRWRYFTQANGALPSSSVRMIAAADDAQGQRALWVGLRYGHLLRVRDGPRFEPLATPWPAHSDQAVLDTISRRVDGRYEQWFGTRQSGLWRLRDGSWTAFRPDHAAGQWRVNRLIEQPDPAGPSRLWAISNQGLARLDGERWTTVDREAGLADTDLIGGRLIRDRNGRAVLWIGTANAGIVRVDITDPQHPRRVATALPAASDPTAYGALQDSQGRVYICTNNGVQQLLPTADGRYTSRVFTRRDGMVHDECNTNGQFIDAHDRFWTGTLGGLTVYDPQGATTDTQPKPLKLVDLRVDGARRDGQSLAIAAGTRSIHVEYALLSWQREGDSRFRTQLIGYDAAPTAWSEDNSRTFGELPPGRYRLRIEALDYAGNASTPIELEFLVAARWWQSTAALAGFAAALLLLGYALVRWRTHALQAQRTALEQRVAARTTELNAANARLHDLSYRDALTGLPNRRSLREALERQVFGATADAHATLIFVDVDFFKSFNDRFGHPAGDEALRSVADVLRRCVPADAVVARYGGEEFACLLPRSDTAQGVLVGECIRNAVAAGRVPLPGTARVETVTISAGVASATLRTIDDVDTLLRNADAALYRAKHEGRNRVCTYT